jgi:hypothetical protein
VEGLKKPTTRNDAVAAIDACADDRAALLTALEGAAAMEEHIARAVDARDVQSRALFQFYRDRLLGRNEPDKERAAYHEMCDESRALCSAIREAVGVRSRLQEIARARCVKMSVVGDTATVDIAAVLAAARKPEARAAVIAGLGGGVCVPLVPELLRLAAAEASRAERVAALWALEGVLPHEFVPAVRGIAITEDSYVRRCVYRVLAAERSVDAMDGLVGRIARESSVARDELIDALERVTGQTFGDAPRAWQDWWAGARPTWDGRGAQAPPRTPPPGKTHYFGVDVRSARVVFVLDCSTSMSRGMGCPGPGLRGDFGEPKLDVAMRELEQALRTLPDDAAVNVVVFGTQTKTFSKRLVPASQANRDRILAWVRKFELEPSTNLGGALMDAFESLRWSPGTKDSELADTVCVLSDGDPNSGPLVDKDWIAAEVARLNVGRMTRVHTVCLGIEGQPDLMQRLARENGGQFVHPAR